jgi:hypothetical protein
LIGTAISNGHSHRLLFRPLRFLRIQRARAHPDQTRQGNEERRTALAFRLPSPLYRETPAALDVSTPISALAAAVDEAGF